MKHFIKYFITIFKNYKISHSECITASIIDVSIQNLLMSQWIDFSTRMLFTIHSPTTARDSRPEISTSEILWYSTIEIMNIICAAQSCFHKICSVTPQISATVYLIWIKSLFIIFTSLPLYFALIS